MKGPNVLPGTCIVNHGYAPRNSEKARKSGAISGHPHPSPGRFLSQATDFVPKVSRFFELERGSRLGHALFELGQ